MRDKENKLEPQHVVTAPVSLLTLGSLVVSCWLVAPTLPPPTFTIGCRAVAGDQWWPGPGPGAGWGWSPVTFPAHYQRSAHHHSLRFTPGLCPRKASIVIGRTDNCLTLLIATGFSGSHLIIKAVHLEMKRQTNYQITLFKISNAEVLRKCQFQRKCPLKGIVLN